MEESKGIKEAFAKCFDSPDRTTFKKLLEQNTGEQDYMDFKEIWSDFPKLAKHILGLANYGNGMLIMGVKENSDHSLNYTGLETLANPTDIKKGLGKYLPNELKYNIHNFEYGEDSDWKTIKNKKFQILIVEDTPEYLPFLSTCSGKEIENNRIYYRGAINTEEATHEEVKKIINRRLDTNISTTSEDKFRENINQLKLLYYIYLENFSILEDKQENILNNYGMNISVSKNPDYPEENFEEFILRMIKQKIEIIENLVKTK